MSLTIEYPKKQNIYCAAIASHEEFLIIQENMSDIMSDNMF